MHSLLHLFLSHLLFLSFRTFLLPYILFLLQFAFLCIQIDSLHYLRVYSSKYGAERIAKYTGDIWCLLLDIINTYLGEPHFSFTLAPTNGIDFPKNEVVIEALSFLQQHCILCPRKEETT